MKIHPSHASTVLPPHPRSAPTMPHSEVSAQDERRQHRDSSTSLRLKSQQLLHALSNRPLRTSLPLATETLSLLRSPATSQLSPRSYYDLYLMATASLRPLLPLLGCEEDVLPYYELVQQSQHVLPRLYLLITVGAAYVQSGQAPAKSVMRDLVEMCAGAQHPVRGLFLRSYLMQMMKDKLPDCPRTKGRGNRAVVARSENGKNLFRENEVGEGEWRHKDSNTPYKDKRSIVRQEEEEDGEEVDEGDVEDSIEFVLRNLTEMNRLWVRLATSTTTRAHRHELRLLVGSNLMTLSRLTSLDEALFARFVFPLLSAQIVSCGDPMAQEYLCDCVISCFPPSFHLATLDEFLIMCGQLARKTNLRPILTALIDRIPSTTEAFEALTKHVPRIVAEHEGSARVDRLLIYQSLLKFVVGADKANVESIDRTLGFAVSDLQREAEVVEEGEGEDVMVSMLQLAVQAVKTMAKILELKSWLRMRDYLRPQKQEDAVSSLLRTVRGYAKCVRDLETLRRLLSYVKPLIHGHESGKSEENMGLSPHHRLYFPMYGESSDVRMNGGEHVIDSVRGKGEKQELKEDEEEDAEDSTRHFEERQRLVGRCVFFISDDDLETGFSLLRTLHDAIAHGGPRRIVLTYPSLISALLRLCAKSTKVITVKSRDEVGDLCIRIIRFTLKCIAELEPLDAVRALRHYLQAGLTVSSAEAFLVNRETKDGAAAQPSELLEYIYTCVSRAFVMYDDGIVGSRDELRALKNIIVTIVTAGRQLSALRETEHWDGLRERAAKHVGRLLTRGDQCVGHIACAEMYLDDAQLLARCLDRATQTALRCVNAGDTLLFSLDALAAALRLNLMVGEGIDKEVMKEVVHKLVRGTKKLLVTYQPQDGAMMRVARGRYDRMLSIGDEGVLGMEWG